MILYTPLSHHDIYEDDEQAYSNHQILDVEGKTVKVRQEQDGTYQIVQLMSTDPSDYLNTSYTPGASIKLQ
ncbi:hypothetical protein N781_11920 [Pontibacillus halophilus JSM 076056 = DSM 19796]|uniref:Uncharacterized protein n=1 Tax=Pontibacillus halophilus JSM 076056 = DSM 19796 TaxID=1385510 RepID=A0A0A5IBA2_9BACI|nr:YlzJ-like family protein [Pontibacillus halophilus]KGX93117.1 hypothetical protein N781_11920 [Pontibacillus halophilus JSM 076056 = DSM 19796]